MLREIHMKNSTTRFVLLVAAAAACPLIASAQATYATPEAATDALLAAVQRHDQTAMARVLGPKWKALLPPDGVAPEDRQAFLDKVKERTQVQVDGDKAHLEVGQDPWQLPIPLVKTAAGQWRFDPAAGVEEVQTRRIGGNERFIIQAALAYVDAQRDYAAVDRNGDGVLEYARRFMSSTGQRDGLIWSPALGDRSPLGDLYAQPKPGYGYHGYTFRILEGQGPGAPGGARSYVIGKRLVSGFGLVAWPTQYGKTGVMSFLVNQDGVVYERDLGPKTAERVKAIKTFDPAEPWRKVSP